MTNPIRCAKSLTLLVVFFSAMGCAVAPVDTTEPPSSPCDPGMNVVKLAKAEPPNPYTNEEFAECIAPDAPALYGTVWCCPYGEASPSSTSAQ